MEPNDKKRIVIEICTGTTCFILGAADIEMLESRIEARWPGQVEIQPARCLGLCRGGKFNGAPYARINSVPVGKANAELIINVIEEMLGGRAK